MIVSWKTKCAVPSTLFSIKKASWGKVDMWKQATKIQQINSWYPFVHAGRFEKVITS